MPGRIWISACACAGLFPAYGYTGIALGAVGGLAAFVPRWRRAILSAAALGVCAWNLIPRHIAGPGAVANTLRYDLLGFLGIWLAALVVWARLRSLGRLKNLPALAILHIVTATLVVAIWRLRSVNSMRAVTALALCTLIPELLWRSAYWIKSRPGTDYAVPSAWSWRARTELSVPAVRSIWGNLFAVTPFMTTGGVPIGKGPAYLAKHEARDADALAAVQVEAVRLFALALLWRLVDAWLSSVVWGRPSPWAPALFHPLLPSMQLIVQFPSTFPLWQRWAGLYAELFHAILSLAIFSHTTVGFFCLMGFHIPRNMKSPLTAGTLVDFWNRYYFYFKELLMDFWFFPVFLRTPKLPVVWRTILATIAAAFLGNFYYHLILFWPQLANGNAANFRSVILSRIIYCAILAAGLCGSFVRSLNKRAAKAPISLPRRAFRMLLVSAFYAVLHVWNYTDVAATVSQRLLVWRSLLW